MKMVDDKVSLLCRNWNIAEIMEIAVDDTIQSACIFIK